MKKNLFICRYFYPAYKSGGPVRSLTNLVGLIGDEQSIDIITGDRDLGEKHSFSSVNIDSWDNDYKGASVYYLSSSYDCIFKIIKAFKFKCYDRVYLNSFFDISFSFRFFILVLLGFIKSEEIVLAPRGELSYGAMSLKSFKKNVYIYFFKLFSFQKKIKFHFTSQSEMIEAINFLGDVSYFISSNMHEPIPNYNVKSKNKFELNLIYVSRISPKKNLLTVIESLKGIDRGVVNLTIAGQVDDFKYWRKCQHEMDDLFDNVKVKYIGAIDREEVYQELLKSHAFILPTLNENYGHSIVEAMANSNVVIISNHTPWSEVQNYGSFVESYENIEDYRCFISKLLEMDHFQYNELSKQTYLYCCDTLKDNELSILNNFK